MPNFPALDVALGLFFVYFVLSISCSAINEAIAGGLRWRSKFLQRGIRNLLDDDGLATTIWSHPLMRPFVRHEKLAPPRRPSYVPSRTFIAALVDVEGSRSLSDAIDKVPSSEVRDALHMLRARAGDDVDEFRRSAEAWFDDAMERVSGWYRRRTQLTIWIISALLVLLINADTFQIARVLWNDKGVRESLVAQTGQADSVEEIEVAEIESKFDELMIPLGWRTEDDPVDLPNGTSWIAKVLGLILTAAALSLGAPFWFDLLGKVARLRTAGQPPARTSPR